MILHGASNIDKALEVSRRFQRHVVTATLLIIKAAIEDDRILVLKLYDQIIQGLHGKIPLTKEDNLSELQYCILSGDINTMVPMKIAQSNNSSAVQEILILRTGINRNKRQVTWSSLHLTQVEISWLEKILWVKKLSLSNNKLISLPLKIGSYLKQCTELDLQSNLLHDIPSCLLELPCIIELNLSHNKIVKVPNVQEWSNLLTVLDLSYNCLRSLPDSVVASSLQNLNISHNQFSTVSPCVCAFTGLTTLNISYNSQITALPFELGQLKNVSIEFYGLNLKNVPRHARVNTFELTKYLRYQLSRFRSYFHMKLILLGREGTGKSTLLEQLLGDKKSTHCLGVDEWKYTPSMNRETFTFTIWNISRQEDSLLLSKRSLCLLVWNITKGNDGVSELKPWLNIISKKSC